MKIIFVFPNFLLESDTLVMALDLLGQETWDSTFSISADVTSCSAIEACRVREGVTKFPLVLLLELVAFGCTFTRYR